MGKRPLRIVLVDAAGVAPYAEGLRRLEHDIVYPIADGGDHFRIDHGPAYAPFFAELGEAYFAIALEGDEVVGNAVGILRRARLGERSIVTGYGCDYKVAPRLRGSGLGPKMLRFGLGQLVAPANTHFRTWRFAYGAAMRGARGDVLRSGRGLHPLQLVGPYARLLLWFVAPARLAELSEAGCPPPPAAPGLDLSPDAGARSALGIVSTAGKKDLRLVSTGEAWPLQHLVRGPGAWGPSLAAYLRSAGEALLTGGAPGEACFALDERLVDHVGWLRARGLEPGAVCTVVAWRAWPRIPRPPWVHLATSEI